MLRSFKPLIKKKKKKKKRKERTDRNTERQNPGVGTGGSLRSKISFLLTGNGDCERLAGARVMLVRLLGYAGEKYPHTLRVQE